MGQSRPIPEHSQCPECSLYKLLCCKTIPCTTLHQGEVLIGCCILHVSLCICSQPPAGCDICNDLGLDHEQRSLPEWLLLMSHAVNKEKLHSCKSDLHPLHLPILAPLHGTTFNADTLSCCRQLQHECQQIVSLLL